MSRKKKVLLNIASTMVYQIVITVSAFILPRILLTTYGSEVNGIVAAITRFLSVVSILRLGVAGATRVELYKTIAQNDNEKTSGIIIATQNYMRRMSGIILLYVIILSFVFPFFSNTSLPSQDVSALVIIIGAGCIAEYFFGITYQILLDADQSIFVYYFVQSIVVIFNTAVSTLLALQGASIKLVKTASIGVCFVTPLFLFWYCKRKYRINSLSSPDKTALNNRRDVMTQSIANIIHDNVDVVVLTIFTSPLIVSVYTVYNLVIAALHNMFSIFVTGTEAFFGSMFANKEYSKINLSLDYIEVCVGLFVSIVFPTAFLMIIPFVRIYTEGVTDVNYIDYRYAIVALLGLLVYCIREPYRAVVQADGKYKETRNGAVVEAGINLLTSIIGVVLWGLVGVAIGTLIANLYRTSQYIIYVYRQMLNRNFSRVFKILGLIILNTSLLLFIGSMLRMNWEINLWFMWVKYSFITVVISSIVSVFFNFVFFQSELKGIIITLKKGKK